MLKKQTYLAAMHLVPDLINPRTSGPPLPVPLDERSPWNWFPYTNSVNVYPDPHSLSHWTNEHAHIELGWLDFFQYLNAQANIFGYYTFGFEPIWSSDFPDPTSYPPGQTIPIKLIPLDKWFSTNSVPMDKPQNLVLLDKWSPTNLVSVFPDPQSLSLWTNRIF